MHEPAKNLLSSMSTNELTKITKSELDSRLESELEKINLDAAKELCEYYNWELVRIPDSMDELEAHFVIKTTQNEVVIAEDDQSSGPGSEVISERDYERKYRRYLEKMIPEIKGLPYEEGYTGAGAFSEAALQRSGGYAIWHLSNFA